jgi:transposase InsO family protein
MLQEGDSMREHINKVREMADQLEAIGAPVSDNDVAMTLFCSLPATYMPLINSLESLPEKDLTADFVATKLLANEQRMKEQFAQGNTTEAAFVGSSTGKAAYGGDKPKRCTFCRKRFHTEDICYRKHGYPEGHPLHVSQVSGGNRANVSKMNGGNNMNHDDKPNEDFAFATMQNGIAGGGNSNYWYSDSAASGYYCHDRAMFSSFMSIPPRDVILGDNRVIKAVGCGTIRVESNVDGRMIVGTLTEVLYVPDMSVNLLSVSKMTERGLQVHYAGNQCTVTTTSGKVICRGEKTNGGLYRLAIRPIPPKQSTASALISTNNAAPSLVNLWHTRLGHLGLDALKAMTTLVKDFPLPVTIKPSDTAAVSQCEACILGKSHRKAMPDIATHRALTPCDLIHSDVCGPMSVDSNGGARYFVTFIDDYSRFIVVYLMKSKSEVMQHFMAYQAWSQNVTGNRIKTLRSDNGGEYLSKEFDSQLTKFGIARQTSPPYTPEHNGVAERANRTIVESARSMLHGAQLTLSYWGEAVMTAVYVRNRCPSKAVANKTPFEAWSGEQPSVGHLRVFGCTAFAHVPKQRRTKLEAKAVKCIFVGYSSQSKAYRLYNPETKKIIISRDVIFLESSRHGSNTTATQAEAHASPEVVVEGQGSHIQPSPSASGGPDPEPEVVNDDDLSPAPIVEDDIVEDGADDAEEQKSWPNEQPPSNIPDDHPVNAANEDATELRRGTRLRRAPIAFWDLQHAHQDSSALIASTGDLGPLYAFVVNHEINNEPVSMKEALHSSESQLWMQAAQAEYDSIIAAGTWTLVPLPTGRTPIGCKWAFKIKHKADGSIERYKARLCAKGYSQKEGIDYTETFAPVAKFASIRALLALAAHYDLEVHQMDVKTAFLNGDLEEDIYMVQPEGFVKTGQENMVCKLNKSLYGLKQASRAWYQKMDEALLKLHFSRLQADPCIYLLRKSAVILYIALYVDDLLLLCNHLDELNALKQQLSQQFEMKDLGEAHFILGIQIERDRKAHTLSITQRNYIKKVVERFDMAESKPVATPLDSSVKLTKADCPSTVAQAKEMEKIPYQSAVGAIMYAMLGTRPDIAFALTSLSQYSSNPGHPHWVALKRVLRYLQGTMGYKLTYGGNHLLHVHPSLSGYCDADWASNNDDRRSITGYVFLLAGCAVSWQAKKQPTVALSSVEANTWQPRKQPRKLYGGEHY